MGRDDDHESYNDATLQVSIKDLATEIKGLAHAADTDGDGRISRKDVRDITGGKSLSSAARKLVEAVGRMRLLGKDGKGRDVPLPLPLQRDDGWERQKYFGGGVIEEWCASDDARYILVVLRLEEDVPVPTRVLVVIDLDQAMQRTVPGPSEPLRHLGWSPERKVFTFKAQRDGEAFRVDLGLDGAPLKVGLLPYTFVAATDEVVTSGSGEAGAGAVVKGQRILMVTPNWAARTTLTRFWDGEEADWEDDEDTVLAPRNRDPAGETRGGS